MTNRFDVLINSYLHQNVGIDEGFLSGALSKGLQQNMLRLQKENLLSAAGTGNALVKEAGQKIRSDKICWLDKKHENVFEQEFLLQVEALIAYLNQTCYTGINGYEFHYAVYETGSFYKRHKDQFKTDSNRKYSLISYVNDNWLEADGGQLWLHHPEAVQKILPHAQTAVFFKSDETEHEVTTAHRTRMSITGWLKRV
jgi:Rps23 Pro-64 3,4-dihydroxylase Tpa1-like proline 4-hydroxylase